MRPKVRPTSGKIRMKRWKLWRGVGRGLGSGFATFSAASSAIPRDRVARRISSFPAFLGGTENPFPASALLARGGCVKWATREKAKVDRIACPWLIVKFVDPKAEFLFVPKEKVDEVAKR